VHSERTVADLAQGSVLHAGRPTVVTVGIGATPVGQAQPRIDQPQPFAQKGLGEAAHPSAESPSP
jgi:uroporphyrin-III C-methyltransferase